jgi:Putative DNA-binding domain
MHMPSLRELQSGVMRALLDGEPGAAAPFILSRGIAPTHALGVYANTARTQFIESLNLSFPAVRRLVGEDYFLNVARGFHARHPSTSGDLQGAGTGFAQHLSVLHADDDYRYLGEVARLEWLVQETLLAADGEPLELAKLEEAARADGGDLRFYLHPSARLFASELPCLAIWEANLRSDAEPELIDLRTGPDRVLLVRTRGELRFHRLSCGEQDFLRSLQAGERFAAALESGAGRGDRDAARDGARAFDAAATLQRFVATGVIVDCQSMGGCN